MIKDFLIKKENILIFIIAMVSVFFVTLGFLFLFFKTNSPEGPKTIPNSIDEIKWKDFSSKILGEDVAYPEYMYVGEQKESTGIGMNISEFKPKSFLTYFSNQNHLSVYPDGLDNQLFYGKTKESEYKSAMGQDFVRTEYLTSDNLIWAVMLIPKEVSEGWQPRGFVWIQSSIKNKENFCMSSNGILITHVTCDPYAGEKPVYRGDVSEQFIRLGYEVINKNLF